MLCLICLKIKPLNLQIKPILNMISTTMKESTTSKEAVSDPRFVKAPSISISTWIWNQSKCRTRRHPIHRVNHQMAKASSTAKFWGIEANHQVEWSSKITKEMKALLLTDSKSTRATRFATLKLHLWWPTWSVNKMATTVNSPTSWKAANTCNRWCQLYLSIGPHKTSAFTNQLTQAAPEYPTTSAANVLTKNSSRWIS